MSKRAPRRWTHLVCLWLSLATVFAHALLPIGTALARTQGSAFSASTTDVSLAPSRRNGPGKQKKHLGVASQNHALTHGGSPDRQLVPVRLAPEPIPGGFAVDAAPAGGHDRDGVHLALDYRARAPPIA